MPLLNQEWIVMKASDTSVSVKNKCTVIRMDMKLESKFAFCNAKVRYFLLYTVPHVNGSDVLLLLLLLLVGGGGRFGMTLVGRLIWIFLCLRTHSWSWTMPPSGTAQIHFRLMLSRHSQQRLLLNCKVASMHVQPKLVARELLR